MTEKKGDIKQVPLTEFFKERVQTALIKHRVEATPTCEFYLVNLLQEFRKTEKLFEQQGSEMTEKPLALILAKAASGDRNTKIRCLKQLGDVSLYTAGFFGERVRRRSVGVRYYIRMGGGAYSHLSSILLGQKTFAELYSELATLFPNLVEVFSEVASSDKWKSNRDLLRLYERWLETGDTYLEELLQQEGIQTVDRELLNKTQ